MVVSESSTAKGVNMATEFNEFKDDLFNKKIIGHKMKRIQAKKHKIGTYEIDKISLSCFLMIKDLCQMMEFILQLIFIKIVSQVLRKIVWIDNNDNDNDNKRRTQQYSN